MTNSDEEVVKLKLTRDEKNKAQEKCEEEMASKMQTIDGLKEEIIKIGVKKDKVKEDIDEITNRLWDEYELTPNEPGEYIEPKNVAEVQKQNLKSL